MVAARAFCQNCFRVLVKALTILEGMSQVIKQGSRDVKFQTQDITVACKFQVIVK